MDTKMAARWLHNSVMLEKHGYDSRRVPEGVRTKDLQMFIARDSHRRFCV